VPQIIGNNHSVGVVIWLKSKKLLEDIYLYVQSTIQLLDIRNAAILYSIL